jgi:hypothetical protein
VLFQHMCLVSMDTDTEGESTHRLDMWMLRFLTEHSLELEVEPWSIPGPVDLTLDESTLASSKVRELLKQGRYTRFQVVQACSSSCLQT